MSVPTLMNAHESSNVCISIERGVDTSCIYLHERAFVCITVCIRLTAARCGFVGPIKPPFPQADSSFTLSV